MRRDILIVAAAVLSLCVVSHASADFVANGNFESLTGAAFNGWSYNPIVESNSVISGAHSARLFGANQGVQDITYEPDCTYSLDFACFPASNDTLRTFSLSLAAKASETPSTWTALNFRVVGSGTFQVYNGTAYATALGLSAVTTTTDVGGDSLWNGETPQVNHLEIVTHYSATSPYYDVTLNGVTETGFTGFQYNNPAGRSYSNTRITLAGSSSASPWLADNVSAAVPEPSAMIMSIVGVFAVLAYAWRKRK